MAFKRIDVENKGFLEPFDLHRYLRLTISDVCQLDSDLIVKFFDANQDGKLTYHDFLSIVLPCEDKELRSSIAQRETKDAVEITLEQERCLVELLADEIALQRVVEEKKLKLVSLEEFSYEKCFEEIMLYGRHRGDNIDPITLELYLCAKGFTPTPQML